MHAMHVYGEVEVQFYRLLTTTLKWWPVVKFPRFSGVPKRKNHTYPLNGRHVGFQSRSGRFGVGRITPVGNRALVTTETELSCLLFEMFVLFSHLISSHEFNKWQNIKCAKAVLKKLQYYNVVSVNNILEDSNYNTNSRTNKPTYQLRPYSRIILEKLTFPQLVKNLS